MPAIDEDDRPKKKIAHEIGQDLTLLSVKELDERVALLTKRSRGSKPTRRRSRRSAPPPTSSSSGDAFRHLSARVHRRRLGSRLV